MITPHRFSSPSSLSALSPLPYMHTLSLTAGLCTASYSLTEIDCGLATPANQVMQRQIPRRVLRIILYRRVQTTLSISNPSFPHFTLECTHCSSSSSLNFLIVSTSSISSSSPFNSSSSFNILTNSLS